jgi:hypothetical protein
VHLGSTVAVANEQTADHISKEDMERMTVNDFLSSVDCMS